MKIYSCPEIKEHAMNINNFDSTSFQQSQLPQTTSEKENIDTIVLSSSKGMPEKVSN